MKARSLKLRLLALSAVSIMLALLLAGLGIAWLFERHVERRAETELDTYIRQISAGVTFGAAGDIAFNRTLPDPRFAEPLSGLYWQIEDEEKGTVIRSRSLWDWVLKLPADVLDVGGVHRHLLEGPSGSTLLTRERSIAYQTPSGQRRLRISVALDRREIKAARAEFSRDVLAALGFKTAGWQPAERGQIGFQAHANRLGVAASAAVEFREAIGFKLCIERLEACRSRHRRQKAAAAILDKPLDLALVIPFSGPAEPVAKQIVADKSAKSARPLTLAVAANLRHGKRGVVVKDRLGNAGKEGESADMAVKKCLRRFRRIGFHERRVRMRQVHKEHMQLLAHAADHADRFAEINLRMAWRMRERNECLPGPRPREPDVILYHRIAAAKPMLGLKPFEIRLAVCRCFGGAVTSAARIASITGIRGPSFGFPGGFVGT